MTDIRYATNGELYEIYKTDTKAQKYAVLEEMAKRIHRAMVSDDVPRIFQQYKLNGAGDQRY